jgi:hypothetical protein
MCLALVKSGRNQRFFDQTGDGVEDDSTVGALFARDMPRSFKSEMSDKPGNSSEDNSLHIRQQIVAPIQRRLERRMPGDRGSIATFQQLQPRCQTGKSVPNAQRSHMAGGQFDCERQTIQSSELIGDKWCLGVIENELATPGGHALNKELYSRIPSHGICRLLRFDRRKI